MKKVYLIHGWGGDSKTLFFRWLIKNLEGKAEVIAFDMPETDNPLIEKWVPYLQENIVLNDETYLVGHSVGCQAIMRYLEKLPGDKKVKCCIFVGGWLKLTLNSKEEERISKPWLETPINFNKVKQHCDNFIAIFSDNDEFAPLENIELFKKNLNAKTILKKAQEHFIYVKEIPEILEFMK